MIVLFCESYQLAHDASRVGSIWERSCRPPEPPDRSKTDLALDDLGKQDRHDRADDEQDDRLDKTMQHLADSDCASPLLQETDDLESMAA